MRQSTLAGSAQLLFDGRDALSEEGSVLLAVTWWRGRAPGTADVLEALSASGAEAQQGEIRPDQLADHLLRGLPARQPKPTIRVNGNAVERVVSG
jgi:hypothetical protein